MQFQFLVRVNQIRQCKSKYLAWTWYKMDVRETDRGRSEIKGGENEVKKRFSVDFREIIPSLKVLISFIETNENQAVHHQKSRKLAIFKFTKITGPVKSRCLLIPHRRIHLYSMKFQHLVDSIPLASVKNGEPTSENSPGNLGIHSLNIHGGVTHAAKK